MFSLQDYKEKQKWCNKLVSTVLSNLVKVVGGEEFLSFAKNLKSMQSDCGDSDLARIRTKDLHHLSRYIKDTPIEIKETEKLSDKIGHTNSNNIMTYLWNLRQIGGGMFAYQRSNSKDCKK